MNADLDSNALLWDEGQSPESLALLAEEMKDALDAQMVVVRQLSNTKPTGIHDARAVICLLASVIWRQSRIDATACKTIMEMIEANQVPPDLFDDIAWAYSYGPFEVDLTEPAIVIENLEYFYATAPISAQEKGLLAEQLRTLRRRFLGR